MSWLVESFLDEAEAYMDENDALDEGTRLKGINFLYTNPLVKLMGLKSKEDLVNPKKVKDAFTKIKSLKPGEKTAKTIMTVLHMFITFTPFALLIGAIVTIVTIACPLLMPIADLGALSIGIYEGAISDYDRLINYLESRKKKNEKEIAKSSDKEYIAKLKKEIAEIDKSIKIIESYEEKAKNKASVFQDHAMLIESLE